MFGVNFMKKVHNFISKKERNRLIHRIRSMDWSDEEAVNDFAIDICFLSVKLRSEIIRRNEYGSS